MTETATTPRLKVQYLAPAKLTPDLLNVRRHSDAQVEQLKVSIRQFGFTQPILVRPDKTVIAGHCRLRAALALELPLVPVVVLAGLTEAQYRALAIADNRLPLSAEWDTELLANTLADLSDEFDLTTLGFGQDELEEILKTGGFDPSLNPGTDDHQVGEGDVGDATARLQAHLESAAQQKLVEIICPHCGKLFRLDKSIVS